MTSQHDKNVSLWNSSMNKDVNGVRAALFNGAEIDSHDDRFGLGGTALLYAAGNGDNETIDVLITSGADIEIKGANGWNAAHYAAYAGHQTTLQLLIDKYNHNPHSLSETNETPLHFACLKQNVAVVKYLLSTVKVNPLAQDDKQRTPIDRIPSWSENRTKILQLFAPFVDSSKKFPVESYSKLFVCGNSTAGKSTLCELIKYRSSKSTFDPSHCVTVTPMTAGMELHTINSWELGHVVLHDFAGHLEYYSSHRAVLENLMVRSPGVFLLMVNVTAPHNTIEKSIYYWINFIENSCAHLVKPSHIIIVGSHIDKLSPQHNAEMKLFITNVAARAIRKQQFQGYVGLDCRRPGGENVTTFTSLLTDSCRQMVDRSDSISFYCHVQYSFLRDLKLVAVTTDELCTKLKEQDHPSLPSDASLVINILTILSDKGLILFLRNSNWVIIDKPALVTEINGTLFAPSSIQRVYREIASNTGIVTKTALRDTFPNYNIDMLIGFLTSLEFCHVIDSAIFRDISSNILPTTSVVKGEILFFPSLIRLDSPVAMSATPKLGYCFWCPNPYSFLSTRFLHVLLHHLSLKYSLPEEVELSTNPEAEKFNRVCDIWINGIHWVRKGIEVLVEMSDLNRCITVLLSEKDGTEPHKVFCSILSEIHLLRNKVCPCPIKEYIITPNGLKNVQQIPVIKTQRINLEDLAQAVLQEEESVEDTSGMVVEVEDVVNKEDPFYCLSASPDVICKLFDEQPFTEYQYISETCKAVMRKYKGNRSSSKSIRNHLRKYSIFGNCQLEEIVKSCISESACTSDDQVDELQSILNTTPKTHHVLQILTRVCHMWEVIGAQLGVEDYILGSERKSNEEDATRLYHIIHRWTQMDGEVTPVTWGTIMNVVKAIDNNELVRNFSVFLKSLQGN